MMSFCSACQNTATASRNGVPNIFLPLGGRTSSSEDERQGPGCFANQWADAHWECVPTSRLHRQALTGCRPAPRRIAEKDCLASSPKHRQPWTHPRKLGSSLGSERLHSHSAHPLRSYLEKRNASYTHEAGYLQGVRHA